MNDTEWFAEHAAYLETAEWAFRRGQVLNRDGYRCQARLPGCRGDAVQVHHLSYKHWRNEPLFELTAVCATCHEAITEMDRDNRPPQARLVKPVSIWERTPLGDNDLETPLSRRLQNSLRQGSVNIDDLDV